MSHARYRATGSEPWPLSLSAFVDFVALELEAKGELAEPSLVRLTQLQRRFAQFLMKATGLETADSVLPEHARAFVESRRREGGPPSVATMHLRRSAIRLLYREARKAGLTGADPARDLYLPPRSSLRTRPLTGDEIALCRSSSVDTLSETRQPAALALAEATARCSEITAIAAEDVDLARGRVWLRGTSATEARWAPLTGWGAEHLDRRLAQLGGDRTLPLISPRSTSGRGAAASVHRAIASTLRRAGLASEPDVRPNSVVAWRGARALAEGAGIEEVALLLGVRSLDRAASLIGWNWRRA
jgi:integrase